MKINPTSSHPFIAMAAAAAARVCLHLQPLRAIKHVDTTSQHAGKNGGHIVQTRAQHVCRITGTTCELNHNQSWTSPKNEIGNPPIDYSPEWCETSPPRPPFEMETHGHLTCQNAECAAHSEDDGSLTHRISRLMLLWLLRTHGGLQPLYHPH